MKFVSFSAFIAGTLTSILVPLVAEESLVVYHPLVFSKVTLVSLWQSTNAPLPMLVTLFGIVTLVRLMQS